MSQEESAQSRSRVSGGEKGQILVTIPISFLRQSRYQVRDEAFESLEELKELADSIKALGLLEPPVVRCDSDVPGYFEIISGHRRVKAVSEYLGWKTIKCIVRDQIEEIDAFRLSLAENIHRNNLSAYEEGIAYLISQKLFGFSIDKLSEMLSKSRSTISLHREIASEANHFMRFVPNSQKNLFLKHFKLAHRDLLRNLKDESAIAHATQMIARGSSPRNLLRFISFMEYSFQDAGSDEKRMLEERSFPAKDLETRPPSTGNPKFHESHSAKSAEQDRDIPLIRESRKVSYFEVSKFLYEISSGSHLLLLYENPELAEILTMRYLMHGMMKGENAVYVTQDEVEKVREMMVLIGVNVEYYEKEKRLLHIRKISNPLRHPEGFDEGVENMYHQIFQGVTRPCRVAGTFISDLNTELQFKSSINLEVAVQASFESNSEAKIECPYDIFWNFKGSVMCRYRINQATGLNDQWLKKIVSAHHATTFVPRGEQPVSIAMNEPGRWFQ